MAAAKRRRKAPEAPPKPDGASEEARDSAEARIWRAMTIKRLTPGSELRKLRAAWREVLGRTRRTRGAVYDREAVVRDWRFLTDTEPVIDSEGRTLLQWRSLSFYSLVPRCRRHVRPQWGFEKNGRRFGGCKACKQALTPATAAVLAKIARPDVGKQPRAKKAPRAKKPPELLGLSLPIDPRKLAVRILQRVHEFPNDEAVVTFLRRAGVKHLPALRQRHDKYGAGI